MYENYNSRSQEYNSDQGVQYHFVKSDLSYAFKNFIVFFMISVHFVFFCILISSIFVNF